MVNEKEAVELLEKLISTPSVSRDETAASDVMEFFLRAHQLNPHREGNNLWCVSPDWREGRPTLLLNAHIDTVGPASGWQRDPFKPTTEGNRLYGLGASDCGGGLVSLLSAYSQLIERPQHYNLVYAVSAEEEVSGQNGFSRMRPFLPAIDAAIVGEPTSLQPATGERGLMVLDVTARGRSGHAARNGGINAIYRAMEDIDWFKNYQFPKISDRLGPVKMSVTVINAGTQHNMVPDRCVFTVDVRVNEMYTNLQVLDVIKENVKSDVTARSTRLGPSFIPDNHPLVVRMKALGLQPFGSPALSDQALMPWPSLKLGPGDSARSHSADEFICFEEIRQAIILYIKILDGMVI